MAEVAKLEPVDLRKVWPNEAADFTPWLAENLYELGKELGFELELESTEAPVGTFSVDILARDVDENRSVIIENQLGATDHDHLGKVLTYAAGYNADAIVWIVGEFRDEHRQTLDWLNQRTGEETEFYGVVIKAVRIGDSPAAFVFEVVARPNDFRKSRVNGARRRELTPLRHSYRDFWQSVTERLRSGTRYRTRKVRSGNTQRFPADAKGVRYRFTFSKQAGVRVRVQLEVGKTLYDYLESRKVSIEEAFGQALEWERRTDMSGASRIGAYLPGRTINDSDEVLADTANWVVATVGRFGGRVIPIVRDGIDEIGDSRYGAIGDEDEDEE